MPEELILYVNQYGYLAIFVLIFLQEIGMPNPVPNELLLIFSGYLTFKGILFMPLVLLTAVTADLSGTGILYFLFYYAGTAVLARKPKWIPLSEKTLKRLSERISDGKLYNIFIFRLTPFTRGYTSVLTGLFRVSPRFFLPIAFFSALIWASLYVTIGYLAGPSWNLFSHYLGSFNDVLVAIFIVTVSAVFIVIKIKKRKNPVKKSTETVPDETLLTLT